MKSSSIRLRVHMAPVGFEVMRVVDPIKMLHADVALLLTLSQTDRARFSMEKILRHLKENRVVTKVVECNVWDTSEVVNEVGTIVTAAPQHEYMFNVSTGPRTASIAGVISGMFWHVRPYFVTVNDQAKPIHSENDFPTIGAPQLIPTFEIPLLEHSAVAALEFLAGARDSVSKRQLMAHMEEKGLVAPRQKKSVTPQALHGQLDSILRKLEAWGFVDLVGRGKEMRIEITDRGIEGRKMFFHMLNPKRPLDVLT